MSYAVAHIDALERARLDQSGWWRAVRRTLGLSSIGANARVDVGVRRTAVAAAPATTVLVVGGRPDAAMPPSPLESWYAAKLRTFSA